MLEGKKIVIGITGGIAAYKIPSLIRLLIKERAEVRVMMTPASSDFVTPLTLSTLSKHEVIVQPFNPETGVWNSHVELGSWADLMIFAPVTANTLGKMAHGISDNFLLTAYLSAKSQIILAPAMDLSMYLHSSTQKNIEILRSYGNIIIEPQTGELASGLSGPGRLAEPEIIYEHIRNFFFRKNRLSGKKFLITAGPTYERIDPVRFIANYSTGRMGFALADCAAKQGAEVILITGPAFLKSTSGNIHRIDVESAQEMFETCMQYVSGADVVIMSAAVADFTVARPENQKIKKLRNQKLLTLNLIPTRDILKEIGRNKKTNQIIVGFALETDHEIPNAFRKIEDKNLDMIVLNSLNDHGAGFGLSTNKITLIDQSGKTVKGVLKNKSEVADDIISAIFSLMPA